MSLRRFFLHFGLSHPVVAFFEQQVKRDTELELEWAGA